MWDYLDQCGVLENGTDADIKAAKREYKKQYFKRYRQERRTDKPEYSVGFSRKNGEYGKIVLAAKQHGMTVTRFVREAALAYLDRRYIIVLPRRAAQLQQLLMDCLNEIKGISQLKERYSFNREQKVEAITVRVGKLEEQIRETLHFPQLLEDAISNAVTEDPAFRFKLLAVLEHDCQNKVV
jgi:hypothetical protein